MEPKSKDINTTQKYSDFEENIFTSTKKKKKNHCQVSLQLELQKDEARTNSSVDHFYNNLQLQEKTNLKLLKSDNEDVKIEEAAIENTDLSPLKKRGAYVSQNLEIRLRYQRQTRKKEQRNNSKWKQINS